MGLLVWVKKQKKQKQKRCPEGKAWAKRTFDVYPSAYANLGADNLEYSVKTVKKSKGGGFVSIRGQGAVIKEKLDNG